MKQKQIKAIKKQIVEETALSVGYYEAVIPEIIENIDSDTFYNIMGRTSGEWLLEAAKSKNRVGFQNILVSEAVKSMSYQEFKTIVKYFFSYQQTENKILAERIETSPELFSRLQNEADIVFRSNPQEGLENDTELQEHKVPSPVEGAGNLLTPAELVGSLEVKDQSYDETSGEPLGWEKNTIAGALSGYDYSIDTGLNYFSNLDDDEVEIDDKVLYQKDFHENQIVVYDLQNPSHPFYFGESCEEAIDEIESLLPFQDGMQDWDRRWDYDAWVKTAREYFPIPFDFEKIQDQILKDLRKAQIVFKQSMLEKSSLEVFDQASKILYVSDALFELESFVKEFTSEEYQERSYSYEKQLSALIDRYHSNPPQNASDTFIAAAERSWLKVDGSYDVGSDDKAYFMENYICDYFELAPYLETPNIKVTDVNIIPPVSKGHTR